MGVKKNRVTTSQANKYDKILRENLEAALPGLTKNLLKKVTDQTGETFLLHIELQVKDEPEMVYRMADYFIMLLRRYKLPVHQYVIYVGKGTPRMTDKIASKCMQFTYALIILSAIDYNLLL